MDPRDFILQQTCAAVVIGVSMRKEDVFDLTAVDAELSQAAEDFVLRCIVEQCLEDDDAVAADDCPGIVDLRAEEIQIVGDLGRFRIPRFPGGRPGSVSARASPRTWS